ncbi:MAG TPA: class I SAM-dependent methyltransferase, partial [Armatimonadota bacterium]
MTLADRISAANRRKKWAMFLEAVKPDAELTILDVGFNAREYSSVDNYLEKHYPWQHRITALGIESPGEFGSLYPLVKAIKYDCNLFPFCDKSFDVCWSNAVIEHVGDAAAQESFLREIARVSDFAFVTTPNRTFPIEVHTRVPLLHFLPKGIFDAFMRMIGKKWA